MVVRVRRTEAVQLRQHHGLEHGEPLTCASAQMEIGFLASDAIGQLPGRVAKIEEGRAVVPSQEPLVAADGGPSTHSGQFLQRALGLARALCGRATDLLPHFEWLIGAAPVRAHEVDDTVSP